MKRFCVPLLCLALIFLSPVKALPAHQHLEKWWQNRWCDANGGQLEVVLPDSTRIDCLTSTNAIEFDFGPKWAESLGQALYYGARSGKRAGIVLILEEPGDEKYLLRLKEAIKYYRLPVDLWTVGPDPEI